MHGRATSHPEAGRSAARNAMREAQKAWIDDVLRETNLKLTQVAKKIGRPASTLTRFYNDEEYGGVLSSTLVQAITDFSGLKGPGAVLPARGGGLREDGVPFEARSGNDAMAQAVAALIGNNPNVSAWRMTSDVLQLARIGVGDILIIDQALEPRDGDVVCAQIEQGVGAKTVFRLYQRPAIVGASADPMAVRPEVVDGQRVRIAGVMINVLRAR